MLIVTARIKQCFPKVCRVNDKNVPRKLELFCLDEYFSKLLEWLLMSRKYLSKMCRDSVLLTIMCDG